MSFPPSVRSTSRVLAALPWLFLPFLGFAQTEPGPGGVGKPAPYTLAGVDVFGNSRTPEAEVVKLLGVKEGAEIKPELVQRMDDDLRKTGKFAYSKVSSTAFGDHKTYLTVDVVEKGEEKRLSYNPAPTGDVPVPADVLEWVRKFEKASYRLFQVSPMRSRDINEGHFMDSDDGLRQYEETMLEMVPKHYDILVKALKEDKDPEKRADCAMLLGWAKDKKAVIAPLEAALKDPDVQVRTNAGRSLIPIAYLSTHTGIPFPLDPVFGLLREPTASDRTKAVALLLHLAGDSANHAAIREKAGDMLVRIAGAQHPAQREHALTLLTLITGEDYGRDVEKWKAWWKAQKAGTWTPPAHPAPAAGGDRT